MPSRDTPAPADDLVELAAVTRAHGLRGEVQLKPFNPDSDLLLEMGELLVRGEDGELSLVAVERSHRHGKSVIAKLADVDDRESAEALRGSVLCVPRSSLPEPEEGEYYFVDLVGLRAEDAAGSALGEVLDVIEYPSVECLVVERSGVRWEIPMLERYLLEVDLQGRRVRLDNLDELEDLQPKPRERKR